ncbi:alternative oxidase, mitochondrial-like [Orbicella faveolata]|uniref:alternative oxidase, mitochondrial-like n=1 Tax=Orbicella faveolata TaxID=48498 RepID=UPI0009E3AAA6|nr:alternative oxidase, mitochondrial-like [Orbicella faveolata]
MLETIAGVPGMIGAMTRHFHALRRLTRDNGWIHTLLEEAENERMHLMTALEMKQPGVIFRGTILLAQGVFVNLFFLAYLISPKFCHRFVGYLEEEAVKTYTHCLECIDSGKLPLWKNQLAPKIAVNYWKLPVSVWLNDRRIFVYNMRLSSISDTIFDGTSSMLVLNMKWHSTINCPKEFEPDVLNTFCATRAVPNISKAKIPAIGKQI